MRRTIKHISGKILITAFIAATVILRHSGAQDGPAHKKLEIVTTLFPTYDFARQIGKDRVNVTLLLPPGIEAHTFEPKPADMVRINKADIFIYTGKYMEPWVADMLDGVSNKSLTVVDSSKGIVMMAGVEHDHGNDHDEQRDKHDGDEHDDKAAGHGQEENGHAHGGIDPHIWLDLGNACIMVDGIAKAMTEKDPGNKDFYLRNADEYKTRLLKLDEEFRDMIKRCDKKSIICGGHFTFGYFARRYGLDYETPYKGFSPNAEPTPKAIVEVIEKLRSRGLKYIYYEELIDPKVARIISSETGAKLELLHGAHNISKEELQNGITFVDILESDKEKLKAGLECR